MSFQKYSIEDYVLSILQKLLGSEQWEPSSKLIQTLLDNLNPLERQNRYRVRQEIVRLGERCAIGHESKIIVRMNGKISYVLSNKDKEDLLTHFRKWWDSRQFEGCINHFVETWVTSRSLTVPFHD